MIPLLLVGLFATGIWLAHEAWTTPVAPESDQPRSRWRLLEEFCRQYPGIVPDVQLEDRVG